MAELINKSKVMFILERELDMNGITDWGKGYMEAIHDAMEHVKFMDTTTESEIRAKAIDEFAKALLINEVVDKSVVRRVAEQLKEE